MKREGEMDGRIWGGIEWELRGKEERKTYRWKERE